LPKINGVKFSKDEAGEGGYTSEKSIINEKKNISYIRNRLDDGSPYLLAFIMPK
jgi:hypothetical protein